MASETGEPPARRARDESSTSRLRRLLPNTALGIAGMTAYFAIHDTMQFLRAPVSTMCVGQAASAAAVLLAAGAPGQRFTLPNARVLIHQPHGGAQGQSTDLERWVAEFVEMRRRMWMTC